MDGKDNVVQPHRAALTEEEKESRRQGALDHVQNCGTAESMHCHGREKIAGSMCWVRCLICHSKLTDMARPGVAVKRERNKEECVSAACAFRP